MDDTGRTREELLAELSTLRRRVAALERERVATSTLLHGDPGGRVPPILEQLPASVWTTDRELRLTWWTGGAVRSIAAEPEDMIGVDVYTFRGTRDPSDPSIAAHEKALAGKASSYETEVGESVFQAHAAPLYDVRGAVCGVIGVSIEITERVKAERQLRRAIERVRTLSGLIPICMHCKSVRNDGGFWEQVETYVREHSDAEFTHAICPDCMERALDGGSAVS